MSPSEALTLWKRTRKRRTPELVGKFFEELAKRILLRTSPPTAGDGNVDSHLRLISTGVEIKAGDNNHPLRVPIDQLERHIGQTGNFPLFEHLLYCLFCYGNRESRTSGGRRRSLLAGCTSEIKVHELLANNTDTMYIFDHRIVEAIGKTTGIRRGKLPCAPEREVIELGRWLLRRFKQGDPLSTLPYLGFDPHTWGIRERSANISVQIGLFSHNLDLKIVEVLPTELFTKLDVVARVPQRPNGVSRRVFRPTTRSANATI